MQRKFFNAGALFSDTPEKREVLDVAINNMQWGPSIDKVPECMQSEGLHAMVKQFGYNIDLIGYAEFQHGMRIVAIRNNYPSREMRRATIYGIDRGDKMFSVAADAETEQDVQVSNLIVKAIS